MDTTQTKTRVAVSTLTVWAVYVAFFYLDLVIMENVDRDMSQVDTLHIWAFGINILILFMFILPLVSCLHLFGLHCSYNVAQYLVCTLFFYITICTITFFPPFKKVLELRRGRPDSISCMRSSTPSNLTLPANHSYFTLEDPEWTVDWNRSKNHEDSGTSYAVAPIVYNGPVVGCQFDPPLWAVCVVQGSSMEACGFNESEMGEDISIRKFHSIHYMDTEVKDQLVQLSNNGRSGAMSQIKEEKARMWFISLVSFAGSTFLVVIYANWDYAREVRKAKNATYSVPSSEDHEMQVCKQHTLCHLTSPDITTGCRSFVRKLHCATST